MLLETDLPVAKIAEHEGFKDGRHIARYFRTSKGLNPVSYREVHDWKKASHERAQIGESFPKLGVDNTAPQDTPKFG
jgi:AraC-like DNA-binding protein